MEYDFRNKATPYDSPMYRQQNNTQHHGSSLYPKVGNPSSHSQPYPPRTSSHHQNPPFSSSSSSSSSSSYTTSSGLGIKVSIKPQYRITPPPQLSPHMGEIPKSTFQFDFDFERRVLTEAEKDKPNWSRLGQENLPSRPSQPPSSSSVGPGSDPVVSKYIASGLSREAVHLAVLNYGDNPTKVREFVTGYNLLREMGFSSKAVAEALAMYDNDTDKALAHFLNNPS